jgi:hypothetical protein
MMDEHEMDEVIHALKPGNITANENLPSKVMIQSIWGVPSPTNNEDAKMIKRSN